MMLGAARSDSYPPALKDVGIEQRIGASLPLDLEFCDESGAAIKLGECFHPRPVLLMLVYYRCPMLCNMELNQIARSFNALAESVGKDFDAVTISFDPTETAQLAAEKKAAYMKLYRRTGASEGWRFLTGPKSSIDALTSAVGFRYRWDETNQQFSHAIAVMLITPDGMISRYFLDLEFPPNEIRDAIKHAASGLSGPKSDPVFLYCFHYDPANGRYGLIISRTMKVLALFTLLALVGSVLLNTRREGRLSKG
jgi:protein SCO1/2